MVKFIIAAVVFAVIVSAIKVKRQLKAKDEIKKSPKFQAITNYIFKDNRHPSRIIITFGSEIFFGPIEGRFLQVPAELVPSMSEVERCGLGGAMETEFGYSYTRCNTGLKSGVCAAPADTGNEYIDQHADILLISRGSNGGRW